MNINWKDFIIAFVLWILITSILLTVAGILFPSVDCDAAGAECLGGQMRTIAEVIIPAFVAISISTSISIIFYLYRNRKSDYKETALVSFSIPFICLLIFFLVYANNPRLDQYILVLLTTPTIVSVSMAVVGVFWKFVLSKLLKQ